MTMSATPTRVGLDRPAPWAERLVEGDSHGGRYALRSAVVTGARSLGAIDLEDAVHDVYTRLLGPEKPEGLEPFRVWNFIPELLEPLAGVQHRYIAFNAGRHRAYERFLQSATQIPVASGTGAAGDDLVIHCLFAADPGDPVENPRQIPAYRYSEVWGKRPPSFARARRAQLGGGSAPSCLVVAGTASIVGEETLHERALGEQLAEIERNLEALVTAAGGPQGRACASFREVRVYVPAAEDLEEVERGVKSRFVGAAQIEYFESALCRPGLRVEIEGLADLGDF